MAEEFFTEIQRFNTAIAGGWVQTFADRGGRYRRRAFGI